MPKTLLLLMGAYLLASLGHFSHNAEFICEYPNLPVWLTRAKVYASWLAVTSVGAVGLRQLGANRLSVGLLFVATYAALGFAGLAHYAIAPFPFHTFGANLSILTEVAAAALLLPYTLYLLQEHVRRCRAPAMSKL